MKNINDILSRTPKSFIELLTKNNIQKFYFVYDENEKKLVASHKLLQSVADYLSGDMRDFITHEGMFFKISGNHDMILGAFVHRTNRGQAAGGVRYWQYDTIENYFRDGLRLAAGMTFKNALAGLWWGGGKGVIAHNPDLDWKDMNLRESVYREYGSFISSLSGCYVTAEDVGTNVNDMANVFSGTRFTTCIPSEFGGSGNPSVPTAKGIISGMEAALDYLNMSTLEGKTIVLQGLGHVGEPLLNFLLNKNIKKIVGVDINSDNIDVVNNKYSSENTIFRLIEKNDISFFSEECDIFSPNATGAILNQETIPMLKAKIICGAANNQLEDSERDGQTIFERGITYIPDFLTNRMGIVNCANEQYGYVNDDPEINQHFSKDWKHSIYNVTQQVLKESESSSRPPSEIALKIANELSMDLHPIFGHRGKKIIRSLVENKWEEL